MTEAECRSLYKEQLPKVQKLTVKSLGRYFLDVCTIVGAGYVFITKALLSNYIILALLIIIGILVIDLIILERKRLNRYSNAVFFFHYFSHLLRDRISDFLLYKDYPDSSDFDINNVLQEIMDIISGCFSTISGKPCRVCFKSICIGQNSSITLKTQFRDSMSKLNPLIKRKDNETEHKLEENTDFELLWYALKGRTRFYLANDLLHEYKVHEYKNSSFEVYGSEPRIGFLFVRKWYLPYKSTLTVPIRHIRDFVPPSKEQNDHKGNNKWSYKGFLCIDLPSYIYV